MPSPFLPHGPCTCHPLGLEAFPPALACLVLLILQVSIQTPLSRPSLSTMAKIVAQLPVPPASQLLPDSTSQRRVTFPLCRLICFLSASLTWSSLRPESDLSCSCLPCSVHAGAGVEQLPSKYWLNQPTNKQNNISVSPMNPVSSLSLSFPVYIA